MWGGLTRRTLVASALLALVIGGAFVTLLLAIDDYRTASRAARQSQEILATANQAERLLLEIETGTREYVLTDDERALEPLRDARTTFPGVSDRLVDLTATPQQDRRAREIERRGESYINDYVTPLVAAARREDPDARSEATVAEGEARADDLLRRLASLKTTEQALAAERVATSRANGDRATVAAVLGLTGSVLLIGFFASYLTRAIVRPVRQAATTAHRIAGGDLAVRMPATGAAEIGVLERAFNTMCASLQRNQEELGRLAEEQAALRRVATLVARGNPAEEVFPAVTQEVARVLGVDGARMVRFEPDGGVVIASWGIGELALFSVGTHVTLEGRSVTSLVRQTGRPARMESYEGAPGSIAATLRDHGVHSAVGAPIMVEGEVWGAMIVFSFGDEPLPADSEAHLANFTDLVGTAIANTQARADLTASRARVVTATDEIRRRIERDLHDGTQQRLVSLALDVRNAQAGVPDTQPEQRTALSKIADELVAAVDDLREISRGIHPAVLSSGGLEPAVRALARRSPMAVELDLHIDGRLPEPIEVAAYYVVAEALANAAKHARATAVQVTAAVRGRWLHLTVHDDGVGGAEPARGSGLIGLTDRVEALGGTISLTSPPGGGTTLAARLPTTPVRMT